MAGEKWTDEERIVGNGTEIFSYACNDEQNERR